MNRTHYIFCCQIALLLITASVFSSCYLYRLERKLDPINADFLSKVSLIISRQERKVFLELPAVGKAAFIEEFWNKRNPYPDSESNQFREEYEKRVEDSAQLFRNESKPGWLTDRGRIMILFGPPDDRLLYHAGQESGASCYEKWLYGQFPVLFVDGNCTGEFRLKTNDLTSLRNVNLMYMHELNKAQDNALSITKRQGRLFDFKARLYIRTRTPEQVSGFVELQLRLDQLKFSADGDLLRCILDVRLAFCDEQKNIIWESVSSPELVLKADDLNNGKRTRYLSTSLPFAITDPTKVSRLAPKKSFLQMTLTIRADGQTLQKNLELK